MSQPADHASYLRQLGRFAYGDPETYRPLIVELCRDDWQIVAAEVQIERIAREGRRQTLEEIYDELLGGM